MREAHHFLACAGLLLVCLIASACGGDAPTEAAGPNAVVAATATPEPTPTPSPQPISEANIGQLTTLWARGRGEAAVIDYSPDGSMLAIGGPQGIWVYDAERLEALAHLTEHAADIYALAWSPDGRWLASGSADLQLILWDAESWSSTTVVSLDGWVVTVGWSPDSQLVATAHGSEVSVFSIDGNEVANFDTEMGAVNDLDWSQNGDWLAVGTVRGTAELWNTGTWEFERSLGHGGSVNEVAVSPDGQFVASGDNSGRLWIWEPLAQDHWIYDVGEGIIANVLWSPDGTQVAVSGRDSRVTIWDREAWDIEREILIHRDAVRGLAWSPEGDRLITGSRDGTVRLWDASDWSEVAQLEGHQTVGYELEFSPDSRMLAASVGSTGQIQILDSASGELLQNLLVGEGNAWGLAWSPGGALFAGSSSEGEVVLWNTGDWSTFDAWQPNEEPIHSVAWSPDSTLLAVGGSGGTFWVWDVQSGELVATDTHEDGGTIRALAWSPDGNVLLVGCEDSRVWFYPRENLDYSVLAYADASERRVLDLDWSPDGEGVLIVRLYQPVFGYDWNAEHGDFAGLSRFREHEGYVYSASFSAGSNLVASGDSQGEVLIWDYTSLEVLHTLEGFYGVIYSLDWSPDGSYLAVGDNDGQVVVFAISAQ